MPWFFPWPDYIKKKACRYLLQHYVGSFLEEKLTLDQLSVDLYNGTGTVTDVRLDVWALNELLNNANAPVEIRDGVIGSITVSIPWKALLTANSKVEVKGMTITLQPKYRSETDAAFGNSVNSMWSSMSMTNSMQLAQECLKQDPSEGEQQAEDTKPLEGLEMFAQTIESVLTRVEVSLTDTCIRLEHLPLKSSSGIAAEIRIQRINYFDDVAKDMSDQGSSVDPGMPKRFEPAAVAVKNLQMFGLTVHCEEFSEERRESSESTSEPLQSPQPFESLAYSPPMPPQHQQMERGISAKPPTQDKPMLESAVIGSCTGKQELKIKIKQNEALSGPKAEVECFLGSMNWFFSPKQINFLTELLNGFSTPASSSSNTQNKPMAYEDYRRVETALQEQITPSYGERIRREPWGLDDDSQMFMGQSLVSESSDMFLSMTHSAMSISTQSLDMESSFSSNVSATSTDTSKTGCSSLARLGYGGPYFRPHLANPYSSHSTSKASSKRKKRTSGEYGNDSTAEVTHYKLRFASMSVTILHEDPASTPIHIMEESTSTKLQEMSKNFFDELQMGYGMKDSAEWKKNFAAACPYDHLRLVAAPCNVELERKQINSVTHNTAELSLGTLQLLECLFNNHKTDVSMKGGGDLQPDHTEILTFDQLDSNLSGKTYSEFTGKSTSAVRIKIESKDRTDNSIGHRASKQKMKIEVELGELTCELDVTIVDRLYSLLHPQAFSDFQQGGHMTFKSMYTSTNMKQACFKQAMDDDTTNSAYHIDINATCPQATVKLRFPCPDFRPLTDIERSPWWKKSVRQEVLFVELADVDLSTTLDSDNLEKKFILRSRQVDGKFQMNPSEAPVSFFKANSAKSDRSQSENKEFDWPSLVIMIHPPNQTSVFDQDQEPSLDSTPMNSFESVYVQKPVEPSPFSSRNVMYESDQMVIPGDDDEIRDFIEKSNQDSQLILEINLPVVNILVPNNEFLNNIYNRLCTDLLLWQPTAPTPTETSADVFQSVIGFDLATPLSSYPDTTQPFRNCKSFKNQDWESDDEDDDDIFQTMQEASIRRKQRQQQGPRNSSNYLALTLSVGHGRLTIHTPIQNEDDEDINDCHGEVMFEIEDGNLFVVNEYKGDKDLTYLCIQGKRYVLYHAAEVENCLLEGSLEPLSCMVPKYLKKCLYLSDDRVANKYDDNKNSNMLSVAVKMAVEPDKNVKSIVCAVGVRSTTLRHYVTKPEQSWIAQVGAMFDLLDDTVPGFTFPRVVTELHVHFWECGIDYRPIHLPVSSFITLSSFSISSTLVYEAKQSLLRFIVDDAALFLSDKCNEGVIDLKKNFVCVMEMGSFELSLKMNVNKEKNPQIEFSASNNVFHIRTCADSFSALIKLILYLANDGDLICSETVDLQASDIGVSEPTSLQKPASSNSPVCQANHYDQMHNMMEEAMKDVNGSSIMESMTKGETNIATTMEDSSIELYYFPDENNSIRSDDFPNEHTENGSFPTGAMGTGGRKRSEGDDSDLFDDDEFCILDEPGTGFRPRDDEPEVKVRTEKVIRIINDHFKRPLEKADQLKSPDNFPPALKRFTLKEMTIVWQMYGGKDFGSARAQPFGSSSSLNDKSSPVSHGRNSFSSPSPSRSSSRWQAQGGCGRDEDILMELQLNKVRFQHEEYVRSKDTKQCSRQILLINDVEIRDRLVQSQINKFLYQYSSESRPKRTHANMVLIKAVHLHPDPDLSAEECCLKISIQPLRLNVDQDALFFLRDFFTEVSSDVSRMNFPQDSDTISNSTSTTSIGGDAALLETGLPPSEAGNHGTSESLFSSRTSCISSASSQNSDVSNTSSRGSIPPIYFRSLEFSPAVPIRLDYQGKRVTMEQGTFIGLLVGLAQLNCSELTLKRIHYRHGLLGVDKLLLHLINEWAQDIKKSQLPSILGGVGPMHSFVQLVQGVVDLVRLPIEQYKKDGRIMRGLQRGANSFGTSTAMAAVELTNKCVQALQSVAEMTYDMVSPGPSVVSHRAITAANGTQYRMAKQPADLREGMTNALNVVRQGLGNTATTLVQVAKEEHSHKGISGAVGGMLRQVPPTMIKPLILATEATSNVLGGMRNQMQPDARKEDAEKWKTQATI
ncbi:autophagy-related protein 2 homolog A-like [Anneissia japonica]|uniref:autophagy-related protein 2 homolog A-like n=1 Tax=Anneissia japonica TaxID=1529436 RepID=UPI001425597A|nr:autophagy-related protein 2 homolog A-like [Anneissia japonica]